MVNLCYTLGMATDEAKLRELIVEYLQEQKLMQLATVDNGNPWVCTVWFSFDDELNLYFFSAINRRHSLEINKDQRVAGAIAKPHTPTDIPRGVQFEGRAAKLADKNAEQAARATYEGRIFNAEKIDQLMAHQQWPHAFYKITPAKFVLFDAKNFPDNARQELPLPNLSDQAD